MTTVLTSGKDTSIEDFRAQIKSAVDLPQTHERVFVIANIAGAPGDVMAAIHTRQVNDAQLPIFGSLPIRMPRYHDKEATDYKKRLLSNCK